MAARASARHRRTAWATGLSLILHVVVLTGMVIGIHVLKPPPEDPAIELQLMRPFERQPPPEPVPQPAPKPTPPAPSVRARVSPLPSLEAAPLAAQPGPPPPPAPVAKPQVAGPPDSGFKPSVSGRMGCDDPLGIHLNEKQVQTCANNMAKLGREAKPLDNIPERKKAEYDAAARRQEACREREVPQLNPDTNPKATRKADPSNINPYYGAGVGMSSTGGFCP